VLCCHGCDTRVAAWLIDSGHRAGEFFWDIHPVLGKLTLAFGGWLLGYQPSDFDFSGIGKDYGTLRYVPLREVSAFFGVLTVPLLYRTARVLGLSVPGALLAALFLCWDTMHVTEARLILMDSQVLFTGVLALYTALCLWRTRPRTPSRFLWLVLAGLGSGASISVKWTGLATPGLIAIVSFFGLHFLKEPLALVECAVAGASGLGLYTALFWVHLQVLTHSGPGDAFMPLEFQRTLIGSEHFDPAAPGLGFWRTFGEINRVMYTSNRDIVDDHNWASKWWQWVVNARGILFYTQESPPGSGLWAQIYLIGNPFIVVVVLAANTLFIAWLIFKVRYKLPRGDAAAVVGKALPAGDSVAPVDGKAALTRSTGGRPAVHTPVASTALDSQLPPAQRSVVATGVFLLFGWLTSLLPFVLVDRTSFLYHYLPALMYGELLAALLVDQLPRRLRVVACVALSTAAMVAFLYWAPWVYALPRSSDWHQTRRWMARWD